MQCDDSHKIRAASATFLWNGYAWLIEVVVYERKGPFVNCSQQVNAKMGNLT